MLSFLGKITSSITKMHNHRVLWTSDSEFDEAWKGRISRMASHIKLPGRIADFGCGLMWLEDFLDPQSHYIPIDYIRRDNRTIVVDLNNGKIPAIEADVAFLSGILEYIVDIDTFLEELIEYEFKLIILSYCTLESFPNKEQRSRLNWVNHKSIRDIIAIIIPNYKLIEIDKYGQNTILVFEKK